VLNMSKHELDELAHYESTDYAPPPTDWHAPSASGLPVGWPSLPGVGSGDRARCRRATDRGPEPWTGGEEDHLGGP
jgi:hypothetical protein